VLVGVVGQPRTNGQQLLPNLVGFGYTLLYSVFLEKKFLFVVRGRKSTSNICRSFSEGMVIQASDLRHDQRPETSVSKANSDRGS